MIQNDYFSNGLKPPTSCIQEGDFVKFSPTNQANKSIYLHEKQKNKLAKAYTSIYSIFSLQPLTSHFQTR